MQCEEFEFRLNDLLDERLPIERDAVLRAHAAACGGCRRLAEGYGALFHGLAELPPPDCDAALAWRVVARCHTLRKRRRAVRYAYGLAAAAAAVLVVGFALRNPQEPPLVDLRAEQTPPVAQHVVQTDPPLAESAVQENTPPAEVAAPPDAAALAAADAADPNAVLARETRQTLAGAFLLLPGLRASNSADGATAPGAATVAAEGPYAEVADDLKPLTDSTAGALGFLMNVLPGRGKQPPPAAPGS